MNCFYHAKRSAVARCENCGREICRECYNSFKSHFCLDCERISARKKLNKSIITILISVILGTIAFLVFKYIDSIENEFVYDTFSLINTFFDTFIKIFDYAGIHITDDVKQSLSMFLCVYFLASVPFGYYALNKISGSITPLSILAIIIVVYIKVVISCFIGPFVMPFAFVISIISFIKNSKELYEVSKRKKSLIYDLNTSE